MKSIAYPAAKERRALEHKPMNIKSTLGYNCISLTLRAKIRELIHEHDIKFGV